MKFFKNSRMKGLILACAASLLVGCGGGGSTSTPATTPIDPVPEIVIDYSLNQAAFNGADYEFGFKSIDNMKIIGAPDDTDFSRRAMLHDGGAYRLYFFKEDSDNAIYQFVFNSATSAYEYGFNDAIPEIAVTGAPDEADPSTFAMLFDGVTYRLYMHGKTNPASVHQFGFNPSTQAYEYGHNSIPEIAITNAPADAELERWAMLHDGTTYRLYAFKEDSQTEFYQFGFNGSSYEYGHNSIPELEVLSMPNTSDTSNFTMLHDGLDYRFYFITNTAPTDPTPEEITESSLNQAAFNGTDYEFGFNSIENMEITGAPDDTDFSRRAMLHDGGAYRLYFFKKDSDTVIYQFVFNSATSAYEYGFNNAIPEIAVTGAPDEADSSTFAMLFDGVTYRLYMHGKTNPASVHQFGFNPSTQAYEYGHNSIPEIAITNAPADAELERWAMLHDGTTYRLYIFKEDSQTEFYQFGFNGSSYEYGHNSIPELDVISMPEASDTSNFTMLHDGLDYRFYFVEFK